jgi:sugar lactone lactonase YvrE
MLFICLFISSLNFICKAQSGIISTYVGPGLPVNDALAITQAIDSPCAMVTDDAGGFYISSWGHHRIYYVAADGKLRLVAGSGEAGFSGDGGPAISAQLKGPVGIALDVTGNLFIVDQENNRIRKVSASGIITTVAGNGSRGYSGDGGPATSAQLSYPNGIAVDSAGNLYISDVSSNRIRKVSDSGIITTVAGNGSAGYSGDGGPATSAPLYNPVGVAVDSTGNLYIADTYNKCIRKVSLSGIITTVAGNGTLGYSGDGGPATSARLSYPTGVAIDSLGTLFIADTSNSIIRKVSSSGIITTVAGNRSAGYSGDDGPATSAQLDHPYEVAVDSTGNLFIADYLNNRIRKVSASGIIATVAGNGTWGYSGDGGPAASAKINHPNGIAVDSEGNLFIADSNNQCIRKVDSSGIVTTVAGNGSSGYSGDGGLATSAQLNNPNGVAVDSAGNLFIADSNNRRIRKVFASGIITTVAGNGSNGYGGDDGPATSAQFYNPIGVAVDSEGNLFIADNNSRIRKVSSGIITTVAGNGSSGYSGDGGLATSAQLNNPTGIAVDSSGNLFIADKSNNRVRKVSSGIITTVVGDGSWGSYGDGGSAASASLNYPIGIAVDSAGSLYIADEYNYRIRKVSASGIINTVAGNGIHGYGGDGGPATSAQLNDPHGIAVDSSGGLFIADYGNNRIRKVKNSNASIDLVLSAGGVSQSSTVEGSQDTYIGYATVTAKSGKVPYGMAVFSLKVGGVTVSEAGVPASPPTVASRVFIDYRYSVNAVPARRDAGVVDINTGIAVVNYSEATANVIYTLRSASGKPIAIGHGTIAAGKHFSCFIDQLRDAVAPDFNLPASFQYTNYFGTLDIASDQPLSVLSLRGVTNQRGQYLVTTTPVADLTQSPNVSPVYFPQFVDGGGYTTSLILMNTSESIETGTIQIMDNNGNPYIVREAGGTSGFSFRYLIPPNGFLRFQTDGSPKDWKSGWVQLISDFGTATPIGSGVFGYNPVNVLVAESGVPGVSATTHARIYVDRSGNHNTGLAIANINDTSASIAFNAFETDGVTVAGTSNGPLTLIAHGHDAEFADQYITGLPAEFTGLLDISSTTPFAALTIRSLYNENGDYLMTTFPVADMNQAAPSPIVFPQIASGGGYATQILLLSAGEASSTTIHYYDNDGAPLAVGR